MMIEQERKYKVVSYWDMITFSYLLVGWIFVILLISAFVWEVDIITYIIYDVLSALWIVKLVMGNRHSGVLHSPTGFHILTFKDGEKTIPSKKYYEISFKPYIMEAKTIEEFEERVMIEDL